jgi:hypothetical protein
LCIFSTMSTCLQRQWPGAGLTPQNFNLRKNGVPKTDAFSFPHRRTNKMKLKLILASLFLACSLHAQQYKVTNFGEGVGVQAIDNQGDVVGVRGPAAGEAFIWHAGKFQNLLPGGTAIAISNNGEYVIVKLQSTCFLYVRKTGQYRSIPTSTTSVNNAGEVSEYSLNNEGQIAGFTTYAFLYSAGKNKDLGNWRPAHINDAGQIVGQVGPQLTSKPCLFENGKLKDIPGFTARPNGKRSGSTTKGERSGTATARRQNSRNRSFIRTA